MRTNHYRGPGLWPGLFLVCVGGALLARELGLLPPALRLVDFWPVVLVFFGVSRLFRARGFMAALFALAFVALGAGLLARNLGFLTFPAAHLWPVLIVLLGVALLIRGARRSEWPGPPPHSPSSAGTETRDRSEQPVEAEWGDEGAEQPKLTSERERLNKQITFAGAEFKITSQAWRGGTLGVTAGGVEIDLRYARLAPEGAVLDVRVVMGGIDIRVPDTWQVLCDVTPLIGGADDSTRPTQGSTGAPQLRVVGSVMLGGLSIHN
jgi:hypothetical protein